MTIMTTKISSSKKDLKRILKKLYGSAGNRSLNLIDKLVKPFLLVQTRYNAKYTNNEYFYDLLHMSLTKGSAESSSKILKTDFEVPSSDQVIRRYKIPINRLEAIRECMLQGITSFAKKHKAFSNAVDIAIDFYDDPYYGDINSMNVIGTKRKASTNYAHSFACCDAVIAGERFCIDFIPRTMKTEDSELVENLLRNALERVSVGVVLLDREFYQVKIVKILCMYGLKFIIPAPDTQEIKRLKKFHRNNLPCVVEHTMTSATGEQVKVKLALVEKVNKKGKKEIYGFITNIDWDAEEIAEHYRNRWGTETNNRKRNEFCAMTTSRSYELRFLYYMLSVALHNIWVLLNLITAIIVYGISTKPLIETYMIKHLILKELVA